MNLSDGDVDEGAGWDRAKKGRRKKTHIELRELSEHDFLDLIDSKNQDKRYHGWLNFKPLFHDVMEEDHEDYRFSDAHSH